MDVPAFEIAETLDQRALSWLEGLIDTVRVQTHFLRHPLGASRACPKHGDALGLLSMGCAVGGELSNSGDSTDEWQVLMPVQKGVDTMLLSQ